MKPEDKSLANIAEAVKRVMNKETEVQPADKDFVDLHSIDKEKRRGSTPLTEKDIEEANEFTKAAAKAAVAGDDEFEFDGKKYPTEMDVEVAKKILGESSEVKEGKFDKLKKKLKSINPETLGDVLNGKIELDPAERKEFDRFMADAQKMFGKEFVKSFEAFDIEEGKFDKLKKKLKGLNPEKLSAVLKGKIKLDPDEKKEFDSYMADAKKMFAKLPKSSPIKTMFGKELVKALESVDVKESTAEYAKSLEKIANDRKMKNLSKEDKATLKKIAAMMAKEDIEEEETERMPYDKVIKKLRDGEWDTSMDVKKRMHLTYTDNKERRKHLRGRQKVVFVEEAKSESDDFEPHWMYDPETGEKERAEKPEDHERLKALGWGHEPPVKK